MTVLEHWEETGDGRHRIERTMPPTSFGAGPPVALQRALASIGA